jgi:hypothetical protein
MNATNIGAHFLEDSLGRFRTIKKLGEKAIAQVPDDALLFLKLDAESNSIAVIVRHLAGNMRSRWTDFLTTDGEKADRNRDSEFVESETTREELLATWEQGWAYVFAALEPLTGEDAMRVVTIRAEPHTVVQAVLRQVEHYGYHVGQIVFLAKHLASDRWRSLSVPRGQSLAFTEKMRSAHGASRSEDEVVRMKDEG